MTEHEKTAAHLTEILRMIKADRDISYTDTVYLQAHKHEIWELGDPTLAEWAGIPEEEWLRR